MRSRGRDGCFPSYGAGLFGAFEAESRIGFSRFQINVIEVFLGEHDGHSVVIVLHEQVRLRYDDRARLDAVACLRIAPRVPQTGERQWFAARRGEIPRLAIGLRPVHS